MSIPSWPAGAARAVEQAVGPAPVEPAPAPVVPQAAPLRPMVLRPLPPEPAEVVAPPATAAAPVGPAFGSPAPQAATVGVATVTPDRPPDERPPRALGGVGGPVRSAAAMVGAVLVVGAFAAAVAGHVTHVPAPAPQVATFHSSDRDMDRFWHAG